MSKLKNKKTKIMIFLKMGDKMYQFKNREIKITYFKKIGDKNYILV